MLFINSAIEVCELRGTASQKLQNDIDRTVIAPPAVKQIANDHIQCRFSTFGFAQEGRNGLIVLSGLALDQGIELGFARREIVLEIPQLDAAPLGDFS